jgi:hypothetical protein
MAIVVYCLAVLVIAAACQAGPFRPVGYYTFDGKSLRPLNVVQRRSDDDGFSFGGRNGWKLPFSKPAFLSALTDRDSEDDRPTVSAHQLLPDYLTHQEFLKPQLQAAGFSGGRIIAGPFPVPLARLPKPPARSSSVSPTPIPPVEPVTTTTTTTAAISKIKPPQQVQSSLPTFIYKATPQPPSYKPVQFPAVQVAPTKVVQAARPSHSPPPPPPPQQQQQQQSPSSLQQPKLVYTIPTSNPVHWHAAHQSGPERQASTLGVPSYSYPAALVSESAGGSTRVSYGGWTPIYSASYAHVQTQQDPIPIGKPIQLEQSSDVREINRQPIVVESVLVPERQVLNQPEAQQSLDDGGVEVYEPTVDLVPRVIIPGSPLSSDLTSAIPERAASVAVPVVVVVASSSSSGDDDKSGVDLSASPSSSVPVVTETKRTVRKRKAKQVSSSSIRRNSDRAINQEVAVVTASSSSSSAAPSSSSSAFSLPESLPALLSVREGRGQGRYIGRVLPASVRGEEQISDSSVPVGWRQIARP